MRTYGKSNKVKHPAGTSPKPSSKMAVCSRITEGFRRVLFLIASMQQFVIAAFIVRILPEAGGFVKNKVS